MTRINPETQERVYQFILGYCKEHLAPPRQTDIARGTHYSLETVEKYQRLLLKDGRLRQTPRDQYVPAGYRLVNEQHLHINETGLTDLTTVAIVADWFENGKLSRSLSPDDVLDLLCDALDRKINPQGAVRFQNTSYITENLRIALSWYADKDNWKLYNGENDKDATWNNCDFDSGKKAREALALLDKS